ncbi:Uncharacterised protein [Vibrio cholerae]|nr:Uncharacterised protein [Vibrio cholerae]
MSRSINLLVVKRLVMRPVFTGIPKAFKNRAQPQTT